MKKKDVIQFFGSEKAAAQAIGVKAREVFKWGNYPPMNMQQKIEFVTKGELKADKLESGGGFLFKGA